MLMNIKNMIMCAGLLTMSSLMIAMEKIQIRNDVEKKKSYESGVITYKDRSRPTGFWVSYNPAENRYEGQTNIFHGTFQDFFGEGEVPFVPTQEELQDFYNLLQMKFEAETKRKLE